MNILEVNDHSANLSKMIAAWAKCLGRSVNRNKVFDQVNTGKRAVWSVAEISSLQGITAKAVLDEGKKLVKGQVILQEPGFPVSYRKREVVQTHKRKIKNNAHTLKLNEKLAAKQSAKISINIYQKPQKRAGKCKYLNPWAIGQFSRMKAISNAKVRKNINLAPLSEEAFKLSLIFLIGEPDQLKDWGGEQLDIFSTRPRVAGHRRPTGFALKGPGSVKGVLTPGKMGTNGDQIQRLIDDAVELAVVQYEGPIGQSVNTLMARLGGFQALSSGNDFIYTVIDKEDSIRLRLAYPKQFARGEAEANIAKFAKPKK